MSRTGKLLIACIPFALGAAGFLALNRKPAAESAAPSAALPPGHPPIGTPTARSGNASEKLHEKLALEEQLKKKPGHAPILFRLAELAKEAGQPVEAAGHLRAILEQEPKNLEARLELGRVLFESGDVAGALKETRVILDENPNHAEALYNLGAIYGNLRQDEKAYEYFERAAAAGGESEIGKRARANLSQLRR